MNPQTSSLKDFRHIYTPGTSPVTLLLLHGTGGDERDLLDVGRTLHPTANLLSPRGRVQEHGLPRFFRRLSEGVFDLDDLKLRTHELADFIRAASDAYAFDASTVIAIGFSNGANIAAAMLLLRPEALRAAALWRPMVPLVPAAIPDLRGKDILMTHGLTDSMVSSAQREKLADLFESAGARLEKAVFPGGHGLTPQDFTATTHWLAALSAAPSRPVPSQTVG